MAVTNGGVGMKSLNKMLLIMFMFYAIPRLAYGDDTEINELRNRIEYLEKKVETMNQTLINMMAILDSSSFVSRSQQSGAGIGTGGSGGGSGTPDRLKWQDKQNWRRLRSGMSKGQVTDLLGEPDRIDKFPTWEVWRYGYAEVQFSSEERINSWHEPR
jgi:hypothetical protein